MPFANSSPDAALLSKAEGKVRRKVHRQAEDPPDADWSIHALRRRRKRGASAHWLACGCQEEPQAGKKPLGKRVCYWSGTHLYWFEEVPAVLQYNRYIRSGYRAGYTYPQCLRSILQLHNETVNVATHLLPLLFLISALLSGLLPVWKDAPLAFVGNVTPIVLCLTGSVLYHTFMAKHEHYGQWLLVDVCGVFTIFLSGVHVVLWWGLGAHPRLRMALLVLYFAAAIAGVAASVVAKSRVARALPMLALVMIRLGVVAARVALQGGCAAANVHFFLLELYSLAGAVINIARVPERWFPTTRPYLPGRFDFWLNSHQIMHLLVVGAMAHLHYGATLEYRHQISMRT